MSFTANQNLESAWTHTDSKFTTKARKLDVLGSFCVLILGKHIVSVEPFEMLKVVPWLPWVPQQMPGWNPQPQSALHSRLRWDNDGPALNTFLIWALKGQVHFGMGRRGGIPEYPRKHLPTDDSATPSPIRDYHNWDGEIGRRNLK